VVLLGSGLAVKGATPIVRFTKEGEEGATVLEVHIYILYMLYVSIFMSIYM